MKRIFAYALAAALSVAFAASCHGGAKPQDGEDVQGDSLAVEATPAPAPAKPTWSASQLPEEPVFDIVTSMGTIKIKLYSKTPHHRDNFIKLVQQKYYDGILFHRVVNKFVIQAGDPNTRDTSKIKQWGEGGPNYTIPAEFVKEYYHKKGALAAARMGNLANPKKASSGSQFYIVQDEMACIHLDDEYTVFGETISGIEVVDRIAVVPTDPYDRPIRPVRIITIKPDFKANGMDEQQAAAETAPAVEEEAPAAPDTAAAARPEEPSIEAPAIEEAKVEETPAVKTSGQMVKPEGTLPRRIQPQEKKEPIPLGENKEVDFNK